MGKLHAGFLVYPVLLFFIFKSNAECLHQEIQESIVDGKVVQEGFIDCQRRYDAVRAVLDNYKRPITVLDLGAGQGYFSFRIARDYKSTCVMVESNDGDLKLADQLLQLCHLNSGLQNIIFLNKKLKLQEIERLADCEHFDVVLAFNYIDYKDKQRRKILNAVLRLGDNVFIQTPYSKAESENKKSLTFNRNLIDQGGNLILQMPGISDPNIEENLFWVQRVKDRLLSKCFVHSNDDNKKSFRIKSTYTQKTFLKEGNSSGPEWKMGINLVTFLMLNGVYPTKEKIKQTIKKLTREKLTDFVVKNLILQGDNVELIDQNDKYWREVDVSKSLEFINEVIDQKSTSKIAKLLEDESLWHERKRTKNWLFCLMGW